MSRSLSIGSAAETLEYRILPATLDILSPGGIKGIADGDNQTKTGFVSATSGSIPIDPNNFYFANVNFVPISTNPSFGYSGVSTFLLNNAQSGTETKTLAVTALSGIANSSPADNKPHSAGAEVGTSVGGNPGDFITFDINPGNGEVDGTPVKITLTGLVTLLGGSSEFVSSYFIKFKNQNGEQELISSSSGTSQNSVSFNAKIGESFQVSTNAVSRISSTDPLFNNNLSVQLILSASVVVITNPDLIATGVTGDMSSGFNLKYSIQNAALPAGKTATLALYWASGINANQRIGNPAFTQSSQSAVGAYTVRVTPAQLALRPKGATHLQFVVDSTNQIPESDETNNTASLAVPRPNLIQGTLEGDPLRSGVTFTYRLESAPIPSNQNTTVELYWSLSPDVSGIVGSPVFSQAAQKTPGSYGTFFVSKETFHTPPSGVKYVLLVLDHLNTIDESVETDNSTSLEFNPILPLAWGAYVSETFRTKVRDISENIGMNPDWLMAAMAFETGETFSPSIKNGKSGAVGLIQFTSVTEKFLHTTKKALSAMTAEQQLDEVEKYFQYVQGHFPAAASGFSSVDDVYMAILGPAAIGKPDDFALYSSGKQYKQNKGLDLNGDGVITKFEAASKVRQKLEKGYSHTD